MGLTKTASRLIARYGQAGTFVRPGEADDTTYPPTPGEPTEHPCTVAVVDYESEDRDGSNIQTNDLRALVSVEGLAITPNNGDSLIVAGKTFAVVRVMPLAPDGVVRFYDVQVRGS
ncbi:hypothetical protein [Roseivivax sp. THAF30]|uniref:hypothetical protein n=1 Tax=Roseivivax sp. THAF30 TaxID=2587852 RepID=UPI0012691607|nr:hypothetical protein [Roseivivax sp. THAF30]QFT62076.1 hypothetical protein FIU91_03970 [Roseivivax sp. THAF30]